MANRATRSVSFNENTKHKVTVTVTGDNGALAESMDRLVMRWKRDHYSKVAIPNNDQDNALRVIETFDDAFGEYEHAYTRKDRNITIDCNAFAENEVTRLMLLYYIGSYLKEVNAFALFHVKRGLGKQCLGRRLNNEELALLKIRASKVLLGRFVTKNIIPKNKTAARDVNINNMPRYVTYALPHEGDRPYIPKYLFTSSNIAHVVDRLLETEIR